VLQCRMSDEMSTQAPSQLVRPAPQTSTQLPAEQTMAPSHCLEGAVPSGQDWSQAPQWPGSLRTSKHLPQQLVSPCAQSALQMPLLHMCPGAQALLQAPQCKGSLARLTHAPSHSVDARPKG